MASWNFQHEIQKRFYYCALNILKDHKTRQNGTLASLEKSSKVLLYFLKLRNIISNFDPEKKDYFGLQ